MKISLKKKVKNIFYKMNNKINPFCKYVTYEDALLIKRVLGEELWNVEYYYSDNKEEAHEEALKLWYSVMERNISMAYKYNNKMCSMLMSVLCYFYFVFDEYDQDLIDIVEEYDEYLKETFKDEIYGEKYFVGCKVQTNIPRTVELIGSKYKIQKRKDILCGQ